MPLEVTFCKFLGTIPAKHAGEFPLNTVIFIFDKGRPNEKIVIAIPRENHIPEAPSENQKGKVPVCYCDHEYPLIVGEEYIVSLDKDSNKFFKKNVSVVKFN